MSIQGKCAIDSVCSSRQFKGKTNVVVFNGFWVWWCYKHKQPYAWCEKDRLEAKLIKIKSFLDWTNKYRDGVRFK